MSLNRTNQLIIDSNGNNMNDNQCVDSRQIEMIRNWRNNQTRYFMRIVLKHGFSTWGSQKFSKGVAKCFENLHKC